MAGTLLPVAGFLVFFLLLHLLALVAVEPVYPRAFKLSRGAAAAILTVIGACALAGALPQWRSAFLYRHPDGDWMRLGLLAVYGHLLSDFVWMALGRWRFGIRPRKDLILHHVLGLVGFGAALALHVGYAVALITMVTEILPVTTGINALGKRIASPAMIDGADRARLHVLVWLRLPLWLGLLALVASVFALGETGPLVAPYGLAAAGLLGLIALDLHWVAKCRERVDFY